MSPVLVSDLQSATAFYDAIIIGSRMYGAYCAHQIWRRGEKVLVLEAGPRSSPNTARTCREGSGSIHWMPWSSV